MAGFHKTAARLSEEVYGWEEIDDVVGNHSTNTRTIVRYDARSRAVFVATKGTEIGKLKLPKCEGNSLRDILRAIDLALAEGTQTRGALQDVVTDASCWMVQLPEHDPDVMVHAGFLAAAQSVLEGVADRVTEQLLHHTCRTVVLTGHSLGAAVATVLVPLFKQRFPWNIDVRLITFGSPHVGNRSFAELVLRLCKSSSRYCCVGDIVPALLSVFDASDMPFQHVGSAVVLKRGIFGYFVDAAKFLLDVHAMVTKGDYMCVAKMTKWGQHNLACLMELHAMRTYLRLLGVGSHAPTESQAAHSRKKEAKNGWDIRSLSKAAKVGVRALSSATSTVTMIGAVGAVINAAVRTANLVYAYKNNKLLHKVVACVDDISAQQRNIQTALGKGFDQMESLVRQLGVEILSTEERIEARIQQSSEKVQGVVRESSFETMRTLELMGFQAQVRHGELLWVLEKSHKSLSSQLDKLNCQQAAMHQEMKIRFDEVSQDIHDRMNSVDVRLQQIFDTLDDQLRIDIYNDIERARRELEQLTQHAVRPGCAQGTHWEDYGTQANALMKLFDDCLRNAVAILSAAPTTQTALHRWKVECMLALATQALEMSQVLVRLSRESFESKFEELILSTGRLVQWYLDSSTQLPATLVSLCDRLRTSVLSCDHQGADEALHTVVMLTLEVILLNHLGARDGFHYLLAIDPNNGLVRVGLKAHNATSTIPEERALISHQFFEALNAENQTIWGQYTTQDVLLVKRMVAEFPSLQLDWLLARRLMQSLSRQPDRESDEAFTIVLKLSDDLRKYQGCDTSDVRDDMQFSASTMLQVLVEWLDQVGQHECVDETSLSSGLFLAWSAGVSDALCALYDTKAFDHDSTALSNAQRAMVGIVRTMHDFDYRPPPKLCHLLESHHHTNSGLTYGSQLQQIRSTYSAHVLEVLCTAFNLPMEALTTQPGRQNAMNHPESSGEGLLQCIWSTDMKLHRLKMIANDTSRDLTPCPLPAEIGQLMHLTSLTMKGLGIHSVPDDIGRLQLLVHLDLSYNQIEELPDTIGQLTNLQLLSLSSNQLRVLPAAAGALPKLETLDCCRNKVVAICADWYASGMLRTIDLSHNQLEALPVSLNGWHSQRLIEVDMRGNPLGLQAKHALLAYGRKIKFDNQRKAEGATTRYRKMGSAGW